jgi:hypothetical protein
MNTYTWIIESINCRSEFENETNVVFNVSWRIKATNGKNTEEVYGAQTIPFEAKNNFTPFDQLTEEMVIAWVQEAAGIDRITKLQQTLDAKLITADKPTIITPALPWATAAIPN